MESEQEEVIEETIAELEKSYYKYDISFHSDNEAWGTIDMESQEAREAIHARDYQSAYDECIQVAAMGIKAAMYFKDKK